MDNDPETEILVKRYPLPTAEEILGGETQAGVPRPTFVVRADEVVSVGETSVPPSTREAAEAVKAARAECEAATDAYRLAEERVATAFHAKRDAERAFTDAAAREFLA